MSTATTSDDITHEVVKPTDWAKIKGKSSHARFLSHCEHLRLIRVEKSRVLVPMSLLDFAVKGIQHGKRTLADYKSR